MLFRSLLEYEILSGSEIDLAIAGKPLHREPGEQEELTMISEKDDLSDIESAAAEASGDDEAVVADGAEPADATDPVWESENGELAESEDAAGDQEGSEPEGEDGEPQP